MRKSKTEKMVVAALLASFSYLLLLVEIPVLPGFNWLKLDFSDVPILIGTFVLGPIGGIVIAFIRSTLNFVLRGGDILSLIGNITGFLASVIMLLPIYLMMKKETSNKNLVTGMTISTIALTIFMSIANYFVITPLYMYVAGMNFGMPIKEMVLYGIVPFNLFKGLAVSVVFFVTYKKLVPVIEKRMAFVKN
ncbi:ECF transporter S component [Vagococcus hydrophili]|uniref:Riboflavin transporter n=1 Tax=Vagococcus hydrophili TaxID=2714947 RepID=A0A6G8AWD5_9ENTE|nr:ECF transporter S component [Vagococcus hydrophili]QIL49368.1 ECF transporter S component [Vagococcus hydrophili]